MAVIWIMDVSESNLISFAMQTVVKDMTSKYRKAAAVGIVV